MQHLDDGRLQAWLDRDRSGISEAEAMEIEDHVASCQACAARLAELEGTSDQARSLLAVAGPSGVQAPDYEDVVRRSRRGRPSSRGGRWWMAAGWAASLVAALGLGWLSHDLIRLGPDARAPTAGADAERILTAVELPPAGAERVEGPPAEESGAEVAVRVRERAGPGQEPTAAEQEVVEAPHPAIEEPGPEVLVVPADLADAAALAEPAEQPRSLRVHGQVRGEDGRPLASAQISVPGARVGTLTGEDGKFSLFLPAEVQVADSLRPLALTAQLLGFRSETLEIDPGGADSVSVDFRLEETALALDALVVSGAPPAARATLAAEVSVREVWVPATRARAESEAGFAVLAVPELPVLEIELGRLEGTVAVRVRQALESGATLTLVQQRADGAAGEPTLPEGQPVATVRRGDLRVTGAAPIAVDSLRALLARIP
jgi:hypothetical protein